MFFCFLLFFFFVLFCFPRSFLDLELDQVSGCRIMLDPCYSCNAAKVVRIYPYTSMRGREWCLSDREREGGREGGRESGQRGKEVVIRGTT